APRAARPQDLDLVAGEVALLEDPVADRVVDVVVDVRNAIDDAHDVSLLRLRLPRPGGGEDPVGDPARHVQPFGDARRLLVVAEAAVEHAVEPRLTGVT